MKTNIKTNIIPIGNSQGIRIPRPILDQCHIKRQADLKVKNGHIIISAFKSEPRKSWAKKFKEMHKNKDDKLIINDNIDIDAEGWEWK